jgi:hypothetical protein
MNLTTATPVEIDTVLADLMTKAYALDMERDLNLKRAREIEDGVAKRAAGNLSYSGSSWSQERADEYRAKADKIATQIIVLDEQARPLHEEFTRRGGWTRAFLATSANGHIHSSRSCSTCYATTQFFWFTDLSGHDEAEIVAKAGSDACTVCYPSAPVNDLKRPRSIFSDDEKAAQQAREDRAAAKAARDAKKIEKGLTADGSEFVVEYVEQNAPGWERNDAGQQVHVRRDRVRTERFKTEQAAVQWVVQYAAWGDDLRTSDKAAGFAQVIEAVAAKHGKTVADVTADIEKKVAAKIKRDSR